MRLQLIRSQDEDVTESRYIGQNSIPALLSEEVQAQEIIGDGERDVIEKDVLPILGLQPSSAPYPFMSSEHMDKIRHDIARSLPSDKDVLKYVSPIRHVETTLTMVQDFPGIQADCPTLLGSTHRYRGFRIEAVFVS